MALADLRIYHFTARLLIVGGRDAPGVPASVHKVTPAYRQSHASPKRAYAGCRPLARLQSRIPRYDCKNGAKIARQPSAGSPPGFPAPAVRGKLRKSAGSRSTRCPHSYEVCRELLEREILVDFRPKAGVRFSPHFYNRIEECDFAIEQVDDILRTHAWEKHATAATPA